MKSSAIPRARAQLKNARLENSEPWSYAGRAGSPRGPAARSRAAMTRSLGSD